MASALSARDRTSDGLGSWSAVALLWGFAEATLFFIVPDVLLSYAVVRRGVRAGLLAGLAAVLGALLGGTVMYLWGLQDPLSAESALARIPAIHADLIETVRTEMAQGWVQALFVGAFGGVPYKIFAVEAGYAHLNMGAFLAVSIPARYARFVFTIMVTALVRRALVHIRQDRWSMAILTGFWLCFYAAYFAVMSAPS